MYQKILILTLAISTLDLDPDPALLPLGGAARGQDPNPGWPLGGYCQCQASYFLIHFLRLREKDDASDWCAELLVVITSGLKIS